MNGIPATKVFAGSWQPAPPLDQLLKCATDGLARTPGPPSTFSLQQRMQFAWGPWECLTSPSRVAPTSTDRVTGQLIRYQGYEFHARMNYRQDGHPVFKGGSLLQFHCNALVEGGTGQLELGFTDNFYPPFALETAETLINGTVRAIAQVLRERLFGPSFPVVLQLAAGSWNHFQRGFASEF
jgi:hypothetical protein